MITIPKNTRRAVGKPYCRYANITGGIAAYKTATIIRLLVKEGAEVKVLMTDHAKEFILIVTENYMSSFSDESLVHTSFPIVHYFIMK